MHAYQALTPSAPFQLVEIADPTIGEHDVEIAVEVCALCHSDLHLWHGDWSNDLPMTLGHEIVGHVTRLGRGVSGLQIGARVGLGWQCGACFTCELCQRGDSHLCTGGKVRTCVRHVGGLAERVSADSRFVYELPAALNSIDAAPLMCAGLTVFAPLSRAQLSVGQRVAIVGMGGLGHLAVQFASAMGAEVDVFDLDDQKRSDALRLGATNLHLSSDIATLDALSNRYDYVLVTTPANLDWDRFLSLLRIGGTMCLIGAPSRPVSINADNLLDAQRWITGSVIGSPSDMRAMLAFAVAHNIRPMTEIMPVSEVNSAFARLASGLARFRVVLTRAPASH